MQQQPPNQFRPPQQWQQQSPYPTQQQQPYRTQQPPQQPYPEFQTRIPEPPKPKSPWYKKLFAWCRKHPIATATIIVAFFAIGIIGNIVTPPQSTNSTSTESTPQSTQQAQPTQAPTQK